MKNEARGGVWSASNPKRETPKALAELRGIARARVLAEQSPRAGLAVLAELQRDFPHGYFVEEREALVVLALRAAGQRAQAVRQAKRFLRTYPMSSFAGRVGAVLGH